MTDEHEPSIDRLTTPEGAFVRAWCACGWCLPWTMYLEAAFALAREHKRSPEQFLLAVKPTSP